MFTAYSTQGQLKPRLILAEGFWDGLLQAKYGHHFLFLSGFFFWDGSFENAALVWKDEGEDAIL